MRPSASAWVSDATLYASLGPHAGAAQPQLSARPLSWNITPTRAFGSLSASSPSPSPRQCCRETAAFGSPNATSLSPLPVLLSNLPFSLRDKEVEAASVSKSVFKT